MRFFFRGLMQASLLLWAPLTLLAQETDLDPDRGLPLEPARWAEFTTSEGTWISLDVSPDGQMIVFDMLGDLYSMPISGGTAQRLTEGMGHDMQPRFSPDGERIVFVSDRSGDNNVWLMPAAGGGAGARTRSQVLVRPALSSLAPDGGRGVDASRAHGGQ